MGSRPDSQSVVRVTDPELLEEDGRHLVVVVLAGVDEDMLELVAAALELGRDRRDLHHVRARADHGQDFAAGWWAQVNRPVISDGCTGKARAS